MIKQNFFVYRLEVCGFYYYGMTSSIYNRKEGHAKSIHVLIKNGEYLRTPNETGKLFFHHTIAQYFIKNKFLYSINAISCKMRIDTCFLTENKDQALYVEAFLIKESLLKNKCCNRKSDFLLLEGRKYLNCYKIKKYENKIN